jgi:hypothetical protein
MPIWKIDEIELLEFGHGVKRLSKLTGRSQRAVRYKMRRMRHKKSGKQYDAEESKDSDSEKELELEIEPEQGISKKDTDFDICLICAGLFIGIVFSCGMIVYNDILQTSIQTIT